MSSCLTFSRSMSSRDWKVFHRPSPLSSSSSPPFWPSSSSLAAPKLLHAAALASLVSCSKKNHPMTKHSLPTAHTCSHTSGSKFEERVNHALTQISQQYLQSSRLRMQTLQGKVWIVRLTARRLQWTSLCKGLMLATCRHVAVLQHLSQMMHLRCRQEWKHCTLGSHLSCLGTATWQDGGGILVVTRHEGGSWPWPHLCKGGFYQ